MAPTFARASVGKRGSLRTRRWQAGTFLLQRASSANMGGELSELLPGIVILRLVFAEGSLSMCVPTGHERDSSPIGLGMTMQRSLVSSHAHGCFGRGPIESKRTMVPAASEACAGIRFAFINLSPWPFVLTSAWLSACFVSFVVHLFWFQS